MSVISPLYLSDALDVFVARKIYLSLSLSVRKIHRNDISRCSPDCLTSLLYSSTDKYIIRETLFYLSKSEFGDCLFIHVRHYVTHPFQTSEYFIVTSLHSNSILLLIILIWLCFMFIYEGFVFFLLVAVDMFLYIQHEPNLYIHSWT